MWSGRRQGARWLAEVGARASQGDGAGTHSVGSPSTASSGPQRASKPQHLARLFHLLRARLALRRFTLPLQPHASIAARQTLLALATAVSGAAR